LAKRKGGQQFRGGPSRPTVGGLKPASEGSAGKKKKASRSKYQKEKRSLNVPRKCKAATARTRWIWEKQEGGGEGGFLQGSLTLRKKTNSHFLRGERLRRDINVRHIEDEKGEGNRGKPVVMEHLEGGGSNG